MDYRATLAASPAPGDSAALTLEMLPADVLRERLAGLGISDTSRVVVYQSDDLWTPSTRVMLTLDYAGLPNVVVARRRPEGMDEGRTRADDRRCRRQRPARSRR